MLYLRSLLLLATLVCSDLSANTLSIVGPNDAVFPQTLLKHVARQLNYDVIYPYSNLPQGELTLNRTKKDTLAGQLDVFWSMTSEALEEEFHAIKIPVYRGLFGFRIPLVAANHINRFADVKTLNDLNQYKAGSGTYWPDTSIIRHNSIPVVTTLKYKNLFPMLEGGRFDYFPRGLNEPWGEIERFASLNLAVDKHIMFQYISPVYFFVKKQSALVPTLTRVLNEMADNGDIKSLFFADPDIQKALTAANVGSRTVFKLENPSLPKGTPIDREHLWFNPNQYEKESSLEE